MHFTSPIPLVITGVVAAATALIYWLRRPDLPRATIALCAAGLILLTLAAGGAQLTSRDRPEVAVMVDCSASTRTASYRDRATLERRAAALLPKGAHVRFVYFSDRNNS